LEKYELPRQPSSRGSLGVVQLFENNNFEQALEGLDGFERIWVIFSFHKTQGWKSKILPMRLGRKIGVFASRSPHRPSSIGISCVKLLQIKGRSLLVEGADLIDQTPILDIKPYLPYSDSFPSAAAGWVDDVASREHTIIWSDQAMAQKEFLSSFGCVFSDAAFEVLQFFHGPNHYNRIKKLSDGRYMLSYKEWRFIFCLDPFRKRILIQFLLSGYDINRDQDIPPLHSEFERIFPRFTSDEYLLMC
jgi:tRNA-Thr(GGU) m(6)t(6)A37 methyltransferase TsaA